VNALENKRLFEQGYDVLRRDALAVGKVPPSRETILEEARRTCKSALDVLHEAHLRVFA
jgi:hypothetical protein